MSASEEPAPVETSPEPAPADADDAPYVEPGEDDEPSAPAPVEAETESSEPMKPRFTRSAPSSSKKKIARPAKSMSGKGKKGDGEPKSFRPGDIVLGRLKGFPPWPSRIADPDTLPQNVLKQRPGRGPNIYCVQFFNQGDFSWLSSREINPLPSHEIEAYCSETHRKATGGLMEAYLTARDPTEWDQVQAEARTTREEKAAAEAENLDELDEEDEVMTSGKRKRSVTDKKDKKKRVRTEKKNGLSTAEVPESEEDAPAPKKKPVAKSKPKPSKVPESKAAATDKEAGDDDPLSSDPECIKVKDWRHKLQRAFLGKGLPTSEEMDTYDIMFKTIEGYTMTIEALQYSKIGKVMKKIATLDGISRNEALNITQRAARLMNEWTEFISGNEKTIGSKEAAEIKKDAMGEDKPETNGDKMEVDA